MNALSGPIAPFADAVGSPQAGPQVRELVKQLGEPPRITEFPDGFHFNFPTAGIEFYFERGMLHTCYFFTQPDPSPSAPADAMGAVTSPPVAGLPALATEQQIRAQLGEPTQTGAFEGNAWLRYQFGERSLSFDLDPSGHTARIAVSHRPPGTDVHGNPVAAAAPAPDRTLQMRGQYEADDEREQVTFRAGHHRMVFTRYLHERRPVSLLWDFNTYADSCILSVALDDQDAFLLQITDEAARALGLPTHSRFLVEPRSDALELLNAIIWMLRGTGEFAPADD